MRRTFSGEASGAGAKCDWQGDKSGKGRMMIVESAAPHHVIMDVDFEKPFAARNRNEFRRRPDGGKTQCGPCADRIFRS
jgi:hypothetical protein